MEHSNTTPKKPRRLNKFGLMIVTILAMNTAVPMAIDDINARIRSIYGAKNKIGDSTKGHIKANNIPYINPETGEEEGSVATAWGTRGEIAKLGE